MESNETTHLENVIDARVLWHLVLGTVTPTTVASECKVSRGTVSSWGCRERKYWGGLEAAKIVAERVLQCESVPQPRDLKQSKRIRAIVVQKALKTLNDGLPDFREQPVPESVEGTYLKSAQFAAAAIGKLCSSEGLKPQELEALANAADTWARLQYRIEQQQDRREKRVLELEEREETVSLREQAVGSQAASVAMLATKLKAKQEQLMQAQESSVQQEQLGQDRKKRKYKTKEFQARKGLAETLAA